MLVSSILSSTVCVYEEDRTLQIERKKKSKCAAMFVVEGAKLEERQE